MMAHLTNETHLEIVTVINRNIAIVIKRVQLSECQICQRRFRLKFSLDRHMKKNHPDFQRLQNITMVISREFSIIA